MNRRHTRQAGDGYSIQVIEINGDRQQILSDKPININDIGKGGFRFTTGIIFELEDRVQVMLVFPDDTVKEVLGRICYRQDVNPEVETDKSWIYGFSVLGGFYNLAA